jgi:long-chain acyl-CoA synthetase
MNHIFLTGATGFLGRHLAIRLLRREDRPILHCLVRSTDADHGRRRLQASLQRIVGPPEAELLMKRVWAVPGDLTEEQLGLDEDAWLVTAKFCSAVVHSAADVRFNQDIEDARERNVEGTRRVAELARAAMAHGGLDRFDWVGTAFVAGLREDVVEETELLHEAGWKNSYEQSKYEAEEWLRTHCGDLPLTIFRPSIIVGESTTGATSNFGMMYWPVQIYAKGWWRTIVGRASTPVDIVPVDFVADAIDVLSRPDRVPGGAYHLTAGPEGAVTIQELADLTRQYFGGRGAKYMDPGTFARWLQPALDLLLWGKRKKVLRDGGRFFIPYFAGNPQFDNRRTREALEGTGIEVPDVKGYFEVLLDYARSSDFGRREVEPRAA